jgi:hypothetical protein
MPFTVDDFQDLIRLLAQRPEWRAELRRHVLSDELLELPAIVRQLAEQLVEAQARADQRLERVEAALERLEAAVERLAEAQGSTETRVGRLEGEVLELRYARRAPAYLSRLARRLRVESGVLADLLDEAVADGRLAEVERESVIEADLVLAGRRREDGADIYLLAEISAGIGPNDVERAADRAAILQKLGRPVTPIVAGWQITAEAATLADERRVWHALNGRVAPPREL